MKKEYTNYDNSAVQLNTTDDHFNQQGAEEVSLLDRIRELRSKKIREHNAQIRELNRIEKLLVQSEAENVIKEAKGVLSEY